MLFLLLINYSILLEVKKKNKEFKILKKKWNVGLIE